MEMIALIAAVGVGVYYLAKSRTPSAPASQTPQPGQAPQNNLSNLLGSLGAYLGQQMST